MKKALEGGHRWPLQTHLIVHIQENKSLQRKCGYRQNPSPCKANSDLFVMEKAAWLYMEHRCLCLFLMRYRRAFTTINSQPLKLFLSHYHELHFLTKKHWYCSANKNDNCRQDMHFIVHAESILHWILHLFYSTYLHWNPL